MAEQIKKWCDAIMFHEDDLDLGTCKTLKMISDHARTIAAQRDTAVKDHIRCCETNNENANKLGYALADLEIAREKLRQIEAIVDKAPELNMSNFDVDQVAELNSAMIEIYMVLQPDDEGEEVI